MFILLTIIHIFVCIFLVIVVLLQSGKAADLAGAFGGMGSQTAFGPRGSATVLSKATTIAAAIFMVTSLTLAIMASRGSNSVSSVTERSKPAAAKQAAPAPAQQPGQPTVTVTPMGANGAPAGGSKTMPIPIQPPPGSSNQVQPQPAAPRTAPTPPAPKK
jgi:preprotein translocase subunit SecG